jgi:hypothetical protein
MSLACLATKVAAARCNVVVDTHFCMKPGQLLGRGGHHDCEGLSRPVYVHVKQLNENANTSEAWMVPR